MLPFKYKSKGNSEYGVYIELYLPKHAKFQGKLYETLTKGFDDEHVRQHFLDPIKIPKILELLKQHRYERWKNYTEQYIEELKSLYWGYSLYEVDGVFKPESGKEVIEERTQVIRIIFLPVGLDKKFEEIGVVLGSREHLDLLDIVGTFLRTAKHNEVIEGTSEKEKVIKRYILDWYLAVGFFLLGYIVFEICAEIEALGDIGEVKHEKEVWLTSFWHFNVNRFEFIEKS